MHNAKFKVQVMKAIINSTRKEVNKMKAGPKKTAQLKKLANARKIMNILAKHV